MTKLTTLLAATALAGVAAPGFAEVWDMPLAYSATNYHSVTAEQFGNCVTTGTGGEIEIKTAGDEPEFTVTDLPDPHEVREAISRAQAMRADE